jgi:uncharacterized lipoprotein YehR (DUF1307 family)
MEAIDKLRAMTNWLDWQQEHINQKFKSIKGMELAFDYAGKHNIEFIDTDYLFNNFEGQELKSHIAAINKFYNIQNHATNKQNF